MRGLGWDTLKKLLATAHTWTGAQTFNADIALGAGKHLVLPSDNDPATPALAFGDGDTGFYEITNNRIGVSLTGINRWFWDGNDFLALATDGAGLHGTGASAIVPTIRPSRGDTNTGIGQAAADQLSLIAGGVEGLRISEANGVANMNIVCYEGEVVCYNNEVLTY